jgi:2-dehydro-3-deoxyphosphooctonate aldolase (KDO 8-P synthase)
MTECPGSEQQNPKPTSAYGLADGLAVLERIRTQLGVPVITDVHTEAQARAAGEFVDILQIPAFLCRQTDLIEAAVATGKIVNLKKGQFLSPPEMGRVVEKASTAEKATMPSATQV